MNHTTTPRVERHGAAIPAVGYGTMLFPEPERAVQLIRHALETGYRHIDTARKYGSEQWVGEAIRTAGVPRDEIWVTTKVTEENARAADFARSVETSLETLGLDSVDLLLIHWPQPRVPLAETLAALAKTKRDGLAKNIGVSNFTAALLDEAWSISSEPLFTNQIEYHPYLNQDKVIAACARPGMVVSCYAPVARGKVVDDPVLSEIGTAHNKSAAQVALRWLVQQPGVVAVPRALAPHEIAEDIDIFDFELSGDEMSRIDELRAANLRIVNPEARRPEWDVA